MRLNRPVSPNTTFRVTVDTFEKSLRPSLSTPYVISSNSVIFGESPFSLNKAAIFSAVASGSRESISTDACCGWDSSHGIVAVSFGLEMDFQAEGKRSIDARIILRERVRRRSLKYQL